MEQMNNLCFKYFSNKYTLSKVMSAKNICIQKYVKRASLRRKLLFSLFLWPGKYLKLETVYRFIESKKLVNIMHICDYGD